MPRYLSVSLFAGWIVSVSLMCVCVCVHAPGTLVAVGEDGLQSLSSDGATLAVQQVMLGGHSEDDSDLGSDDEDHPDLSDANISRLGLDHSSSLQ